MAPSPPPAESLPLLASASSASARSFRARSASFESGFPLVVDASRSPVAVASAASRAEPPRTPASGAMLTLTLVMSAVGAGTLAVPYTFVLLPPAAATLALALVGGAMFFTADAILRVHVAVAAAAAPAPEQRATYQALALAAGGAPLANAAGALTALAVFGACVGCVRVVRDMAPSLLAAAGAPASDAAASAAVWAVFMAAALPLGLARGLSALRFSSYLGFAASLFLVAAVAVRAAVSPPVARSADDHGGDALAPAHAPAALVWRLAEAVGIYNFAFMLHLNVIPLLAQLVATEAATSSSSSSSSSFLSIRSKSRDDDRDAPVPEQEREQEQEQPRQQHHQQQQCRRSTYSEALARGERVMRARLATAVAACVALYAAFGLSAAARYGPATEGNILLNLARDPGMALPRAAVLLALLSSFPLLFHPLRVLVLELAAPAACAPCQRSRLAAPAVSAALLAAQVLCALRVPGVQVVFSFVGASILLALCYLLPLVFFSRLYPWRRARGGSARLAALVALAAVASVFSALATAELAWQ